VTEGYVRIGTQIQSIGASLGDGITADAAISLQLPQHTRVATGLIDAHAGGLGMV
jgi:D-ribulokinase